MKKRVFSILLAMLAACGALLAGCQKEEVSPLPEPAPEEETEPELPSQKLEGEALVWSMGSQPESCDPAQYTTAAEASVLNNVMEGLFRISEGEAQPALAEQTEEPVENEDGTVTYTYRLRAAQWSDGEAVTANDFVYAWQRAAANADNPYAYLFAMFATAEPESEEETPKLLVEAQGDDTLQLTLRGDVPYLEQLLALPAFFPLREDAPADALSGGAVFNGPFTVGEITPGVEMILEKNEAYHSAGEVSLDYVVGKVLTGDAREWEENKVDLGMPTAETQGQADALEFCGTQYLLIHKNTQTEALKEQKVRQALSLALDRAALVEEAVGAGTPALGLVPLCAGGTGEFLQEQADLEEAKALLEEAGVSGEEMELELLTLEGQVSQAVAEAVAVMWEKLGLTVSLNVQQPEAYQENLTGGAYPGAALSGWYGDANDPAEFLNVFLSVSQSSFNGYNSLEYNKAMLEAFPKTGEERLSAMAEAEKILLEDCYVIPLYHSAVTVAGGEAVQNWEVDNRGVYWFGQAAREA